MRFLGDIHGKLNLIPSDRPEPVIQLGDLGVGFVHVPMMENFRFIRGNHDNPELCRIHPNYIGDWAIEGTTLFLSGAGSIDKYARREGIDWWREEELSTSQMNEVLNLNCQVNLVVAHDVPEFVYTGDLGIYDNKFITPKFLNAVADKFRPKRWIAGHHHLSLSVKRAGIDFIVLAEGELM